MLSLTELQQLIADGAIDTVIVAFCDMQGRLTGKRVSARLFVEEVAEHGAECCNYLLAVDVDMNTVDGYAMSSWETGYGDMVMKPDFSTLRRIPWLPGTAFVMADLSWDDDSPVTAAPRSILNRQLDRLAAQGLVPYVGTELEFMVFDDSYRDAWSKGYRGLKPATDYNVDYAIVGLDENGTAAARHPARDERRGHVLRRRQGQVQPRSAGDRVPVTTMPRHLQQPHDLQEWCQGDRRPAGQEPDLHGEIR